MKNIITVILAVVSATFFGSAASNALEDKMNEISVNHEWGRLKEVIVGIGDGLIMPGYSDKVSFIYDKKFIESMKKYSGKPAAEIEPEASAKVIEQIDNLAKTLEGMGVKVHRPRLLNTAESGYLKYVQAGQMQLYARDPILVIGHTIIETSLKVPMRAKEKFPIRDIITERLKNTRGEARFLAMPSPDPDFSEEGMYFEGGDVLLNGYEIYVGNSGRGSNRAGIDWLQDVLGPKYKVHEIKISPEFEHLDCVLSLPCPGLMVICKEAITGELPPSIRKWDAIEVSIEEAKRLGANLLVVDKNTCSVDKQHHRVAEEQKKRGKKVTERP
jgi:N-dimethylarginine dimethylaminohydrolase